MPCSTDLSNAIVMNKYVWMSRQLRNFNDIGAIVGWANAMLYVKSLLLEPSASTPVLPESQSSSSHPSNQRPLMASIGLNPYPDFVISQPTTISFLPPKTILLTQSPASCSNYEPCIPSPLTTYTLRLPTVCPTDSLPQCTKRRKIAIPPSVDYHASTTSMHSASMTITHPKSTDEGLIKTTLWEVLDWFNNRGRLHFENDTHVPVWAKEHAESRLKLPENTLDSWNELILKTVAEYYNHHGRKPIKWVVK